MLSPTAFEEQRRAICRSGPPSEGDDLLGMEIDFLTWLGDTTNAFEPHGLWDEAVVERDERDEWLIDGSARAKAGVTADQVEAALAMVWTQELRYQYREVHTLVTESTLVTLMAVTQIGAEDFWVTARVRIALPDPSSAEGGP
jgi:hypothetical protein